jgi:outer membrane immunogenic protein
MTRYLALASMAAILSLPATNASAQQGTLPDFSGPYLGAAIGFASHHVDITVPTAGEFKDTDTGFTGGGYLGYNWFLNCFLLGIETDFNGANTSPTGVDVEVGGAGTTGLTETTTYNSKLNWFGTLRGRVGTVFLDNWLVYATGGLAYANVSHTLNDNCVGCANFSFGGGTTSQSNTSTKIGWTGGFGTEYLFAPHWLLRAEGLYVDLGSEDRTYFATTTSGAVLKLVTNWDDQFWVGRFGVTYQFDMPYLP